MLLEFPLSARHKGMICVLGWFDPIPASVPYSVYVQSPLWHLEPYSIRKIIGFILFYINGPFEIEEMLTSLFLYFDTEAHLA